MPLDCLVVNQNKVKISLTAAEIKKYCLNSASEQPRKKTAVKYWGIIDDVSKKLDGFTFGEKLLLETYFIDSGAEIFVTKLSKTSDLGERPSSSAKLQGSIILTARSAVYPFYKLDELFDAVLRIGKTEGQKSSLFYSDSGVYYLFCEERSVLGVSSNLLRMSEFSRPMPPLVHYYIFEHSREIIRDNAIEVIIEMQKKK